MPFVFAYSAVVLAAAVAVLLDSNVSVDVEIRQEFVVFAVLYIVAQATERLTTPLVGLVAGEAAPAAKKEVKVAQAALLVTAAGETPDAASESARHEAEQQLELAKAERKRALFGWAIASCFALVICGFLSLGLIESVATVTGTESEVTFFQRVDVVVTGLAVGAGTKPLHDLITRLENSKQNSDPVTKPAPS